MTHRSNEAPKGTAAYPFLPKWTDSEAMNLIFYAAVPQHTFYKDPDGLLRFKRNQK